MTGCPVTTMAPTPLTALAAEDGAAQCRHALAGPAFYFAPALQAWLAVSAEAVREVLHSRWCHVRPPAAPLPPALRGRPLGRWFGLLLRQRDDSWHGSHKPALTAALATVDGAALQQQARQLAERPPSSAQALDTLGLLLPMRLLADLLGLPVEALPERAAGLGSVLAALAADADIATVDAGDAALPPLLAWVGAASATPLTLALQQAIPDAEARAANVLGLLQQAREACAALIALGLYTLASDDDAWQQLQRRPQQLGQLLTQWQVGAAPVQLTRRYLVADGEVCGQPLRRGDCVLLWLAAANLDAAHHDYGYGGGAHRCPGQHLAAQLAAGVLQAALAWPPAWRQYAAQARLRASPNARWYRFAVTEGKA